MAAVDKFSVSIDCSGPGAIPLLSKTDVNVIALTAANFNAQVAATTALEGAIEPLTDGVVKSTSLAILRFINSGYPSGVANRGSKWIVTAKNAAGRLFTYTIPAAPGTGELNADNITANLSGTNWAAFVTAFNAVAVDPDGNALTVLRAKLGGRRR